MATSLEEQAVFCRAERLKNDADFSTYNLPLFSEDPAEFYEYLMATELSLIPGGDYIKGSAEAINGRFVIRGLNGVLLTAEHATVHKRKNKEGKLEPKEENSGTGALAVVNARETLSDAIVAIGQQNGDPNHSRSHSFKNLMRNIIKQSAVAGKSRAHLSLHGSRSGHASGVTDKIGFSVELGIGNHASEATRTLAEDILKKEIGPSLGLRVVVNEPFIRFDKETGALRFNEDGSIKTLAFSAGDSRTTRAFAQRVAKSLGIDNYFVAMQLELSDVLRLDPHKKVSFPTQHDREIGAYLGYVFVRQAVESVARL